MKPADDTTRTDTQLRRLPLTAEDHRKVFEAASRALREQWSRAAVICWQTTAAGMILEGDRLSDQPARTMRRALTQLGYVVHPEDAGPRSVLVTGADPAGPYTGPVTAERVDAAIARLERLRAHLAEGDR